jgi:(E)-4-hydroxy-3-methylbut-2-enyl-diphosphate synthase
MVTGTVKSAIGLGSLLWAGIGDTIRVSLSADPVEEVKVGYEILKALGLRRRGVTVISCPSCARQQFQVIKTVEILEQRLAHISTPLTLSVIGCVVNGPGEARETDIGLTGGGNDTHQVYIAGVPHHRLKDQGIVDHLVELVEKKAAEIEAAKPAAATADAAAS